jgi:hypothetical protein
MYGSVISLYKMWTVLNGWGEREGDPLPTRLLYFHINIIFLPPISVKHEVNAWRSYLRKFTIALVVFHA